MIVGSPDSGKSTILKVLSEGLNKKFIIDGIKKKVI